MESPVRRPLPADLTLIETFGRRDGGFVGLADHLLRLERSAAALGMPCDRAAIARALAAVAPPEGLDQRQVGGKGSANRAFHSASSYSDSAVESATTPPPTFSTAAPSGWSVSVRIATLNAARPSGAAQPIAPQ